MNLDVMYFCRPCRYAFVKSKEILQREIAELCPQCHYAAMEAYRNTEIDIQMRGENMSDEEQEKSDTRRAQNLLKKQQAMAKARAAKKSRQITRVVKDAAL